MHDDLRGFGDRIEQLDSDVAGDLYRAAQRRADKIERLLNGERVLVDHVSDVRIGRHVYGEGSTYSFMVATGGGIVIHYQCYNPPRFGELLETLLYVDRCWEGCGLASMDERTTGAYLEVLVDDLLLSRQA